MKKILFLFLALPINILMGMESKYSYKQNTCNLGYRNSLSEYQCKSFSRWEAFLGEKCIGSVAYHNDSCAFAYIYILKEYRHKGLGKILFFKAIEDMKKHGCKRARWTSSQKAIPFYKKLGAKAYDNTIPWEMYMNTEEAKEK